jgi:hypothetical protein
MNNKISLVFVVFSLSILLVPTINASNGEIVLFSGFGGHAFTEIDFGPEHPKLNLVAWDYEYSTFGSFQELIFRVFDEGELMGIFKITDSEEYNQMWMDMDSSAETIVVDKKDLEMWGFSKHAIVTLKTPVETTFGIVHPFTLLLRGEVRSSFEMTEVTNPFSTYTINNKFWLCDAAARVIIWDGFPHFKSTEDARIGYASREIISGFEDLIVHVESSTLPLFGAQVTISSSDGIIWSGTTDSDGDAQISYEILLPNTEYRIYAAKSGYTTEMLDIITSPIIGGEVKIQLYQTG